LIGETKHQTSSHSKRLFLVFDFSRLVLYTLGHKNNNNCYNNNTKADVYGAIIMVQSLQEFTQFI